MCKGSYGKQACCADKFCQESLTTPSSRSCWIYVLFKLDTKLSWLTMILYRDRTVLDEVNCLKSKTKQTNILIIHCTHSKMVLGFNSHHVNAFLSGVPMFSLSLFPSGFSGFLPQVRCIGDIVNVSMCDCLYVPSYNQIVRQAFRQMSAGIGSCFQYQYNFLRYRCFKDKVSFFNYSLVSMAIFYFQFLNLLSEF